MNNNLIVLTGPTAVGKTDLSIKLAKKINGEIISADSIQVYKHFDIGSAKIMPEEMCGIRHYLIDVLDPHEDFNVALFKTMSKEAINKIISHGAIPIITGGTGFYIQAILNDIEFKENVDDGYREYLNKLLEEHGAKYLHNMLNSIDPVSALNIHMNNTKRVIRAIEYYHQTNEKISMHNETERQKTSPYNFAYFVLNCNRDLLYQRIEKRIDIMIDNGLIDEVKFLMQELKLNRNLVSMQGLGYKEIASYLDGEISLEEAIYILKRDTRHFAKRQLTWFKREKDVIWIDKDKISSEEEQLKYILHILEEKNIYEG